MGFCEITGILTSWDTHCRFDNGEASVGSPRGASCGRLPCMGLDTTVTDESATEGEDGGIHIVFFFLGFFVLVIDVVGESALFLGPLAGIEDIGEGTTTVGADEGPGVGSAGFFLPLPFVAVVGGTPGSVGGQGLSVGSNRAWRSGSPTTGVCFASSLM